MTASPATIGGTARELSPQEQEERAQLAYELDETIKAAIRKGREALWELSEALYQFDEESGWTALGYENLGEWLADPEVSLTRATYFRMVQSWRELAVLRRVPAPKLAELDQSKVQIVLPKVKAGSVKLADALADVEALGARDLRTKYMRRPDPADAQEPDDGLNVETHDDGLDPDVAAATTVINDGTDNTPTLASETPPVVEGTAKEVEPLLPYGTATPGEEPAEPAHNADTVPSGHLEALDPLIAQARAALATPQRLSGSRQAVRQALEALLDALEELA